MKLQVRTMMPDVKIIMILQVRTMMPDVCRKGCAHFQGKSTHEQVAYITALGLLVGWV